MNKQAYRVIFNKKRGMLMAVAENVSSQATGKGSGSESGTTSLPLLRLVHLGVAIAALFGTVTVVQAQIVADPNAGAQRPTIDQSANGRPLVQIAAPNAAGLSHNQYNQFNVDRNGAILNNARAIAQTRLGGYVDGNANLTNGSARLILNEVTGTGRSQLNGYIEVASQRAQVIVANPNGISCSGCGFINTSRGVLTTGTPVFGGDGSLNAFRVGRGDIQIGGLNGANTGQLDLIARSVRVNRELWANNLHVVSGANQVNYADLGVQVIQGEGDKPTVGIDVAQLGGMYANKIRLIGTAAGVGVASLGNIAAQAGDVSIDSHGKVTLNGDTSASGRIAIRSDDAVSNSGTLYGKQAVQINSAGQIGNSGMMAAQNDLTLTAAGIQSSGTLAAGSDANGQVTQAGNLNLSTSGAITATGQNTAGGNLAMNGASLNLTHAHTNAAGSTALIASAGDIDHTGGTLQAAGSTTINASGALTNNQGTLSASQLTSHSASLSNSGGMINQSGSGATTIATTGALDNHNGAITANAQHLTLQAGSLSNDAGNIQHAGAGALTLNSGALSNLGGSIATNGSAAFNVIGNLDNAQGTVQAAKALQISAANIDNSAGRLTALHTDGLSLNASGQLSNTGGNIGSAADLDINAGTLAGDGNISAGQDASIQLQGNYTNSAGNRISANRDLRVRTSGDLINAGTLASVRNLSLAANNITNQYGALIHAGGGTALINANNALYNIGRIYGDDIAIGARSVVNDGVLHPDGSTHQAGVIAARNTLQIGARHITNREHALLQSLGDMTLGGALDGNHQVSGSAADILNASATIDAGGALRLHTAALMNQNNHFTTELQVDPGKTRRVTEYRSWIDGSWYRPDQVAWDDSGDGGIVLVLPGNARFEKFYKRDYTQTVARTVVKTSDPGKITAGGHMLLSGSVTNDKSTMIAGGTISGSAGPVDNLGASGEIVTTNSMTAGENYYHWVDGHPHQNHYKYDHNGASYDVALPATLLALQVWTKQENTRPITGPNQAVGNHVDKHNDISGNHQTIGHAASPLPNLTLPNSQLFQLRPRPGQSYLIETDPTFTNYQHFISSDYLLSRLALDPQKVHKRLGDGFYEQKLINDQITQLTGKRFLGNYASNEEQYKALMEAGSASAAQFQLTPGIALSAAQMAALTSDIVWLVNQDVTLPDGSTSSVLVPVVYLTRASAGDIAPSGALISGKDIDLTINGSLDNGGTLQASNNLIVHASDIANTGELHSTGTDGHTILAAQNDVLNNGGNVAGHRVGILAGRDVKMDTEAIAAASVNGTNTVLGRVASVTADQLSVQAGRDLNLTAVNTHTTNNVAYDSRNHLNESQTQVTGSSIHTGGKLALIAARDINATAAYANAGGQLAAVAGRDVKLGSAEQSSSLDQAIHTTSKGLLSSSTSSSQANAHSTDAIGSTLSGDAVIVQAGRDIGVIGSNVVATHDVALAAGNNVSITTSQNTVSQSSSSEEKTSGMFSSGMSVTMGNKEQSDQDQYQTVSNNGSMVGSTNGNLAISTGNQYTQTGSQVMALDGDIGIAAKTVDINAAYDTAAQTSKHHTQQSGLSLGVSAPIITAVQTVRQMGQATDKTDDPRMQLMAAATAASAAGNAASAAQNPTEGVTVSLTVGASSSDNESKQTGSTVVGSNVKAGGNVIIAATSAGQDRHLNIIGSNVSAAQNALLKADGDINLQAAQGSSDQHSSSASSSAAVGIAATYGSNGSDVTHANSHVSAGKTLILESGHDTNLIGGVASANQVLANVGTSGQGNLNIHSLQDTSTYNSKDQSIGGSVTIGFGASGSISASQSKVNGDYASVGEQSGIKAGDGGFIVNVNGNTDLKGGVIASSDQAAQDNKNLLITQTLTHSDIENHSSYDASSVSVGGGYGNQDSKASGNVQTFKGGATGTSAGFSSTSGNASGTSHSGVSAATIVIGDDQKQQQLTGQTAAQTIASIQRDVGTDKETTGSLSKDWDRQQLKDKVTAEAQITAAFGQQAAREIGDYAGRKQAEALVRGDKEEAAKWAEGGSYRVALHTGVGALTGGVSGAAGAFASAKSMTAIAAAIDKMDVPEAVRQGLSQVAATAIGATVGGGAGAAAGLNVEANNRQLHQSEKDLIELPLKFSLPQVT